MAKRRTRPQQEQTTDYQHSQQAVQRPDVGVQDQFSAKKPPKNYRYDSSLDPALSWDENRDRELAEWLLGLVKRCAAEGEAAVFKEPQVWAGGNVRVESLKATADLLQTLTQPFLRLKTRARSLSLRNDRDATMLSSARASSPSNFDIPFSNASGATPDASMRRKSLCAATFRDAVAKERFVTPSNTNNCPRRLRSVAKPLR